MFFNGVRRMVALALLKRSSYCLYQHTCRLLKERLLRTRLVSSRCWMQRIKLVGVGGLCALPVHKVKENGSHGLPAVDPSTLTTKTLIKNAAAMTVDSASTLLTQTFVAVISKYKELAQDIEVLMGKVLEQHRAEKLGYESEVFRQAVIEARVNVDDRKHELQDLENILNSALLTLEAASEAAFQAGNEDLAMMGRDRCQYANTQIALARAVVKKAEEALVKVQAESIVATKVDDEDGGGSDTGKNSP